MNIVMITPDAYMIDRRILLEAKTLINQGHDVTLLAGFECQKEERYILDGIKIHRYVYDWDDERLKKVRAKLPNNDNLKMFVNKSFMLLAKKLFELNPFEMFMAHKLIQFDADVIHVHDLPCLKVGLYAAKKKNIPLVYDAHELYYAQDILGKKQQKFYYKLEKKYIKKADTVITVNPFIGKLMEERYRISTPNIIMNCTEKPNNFEENQTKNILKEKGNIPDDWKVILYQGWISPERNIETLVRGVKYFPEKTCLAIIGYGEYEKNLRDIVVEEHIEDKVFFLGKVESDEMLNYSVGADIGVIPYRPIDDNHLYCSPNKLFEYVLAGVPIISDSLPFFEMMKKDHGFIVTTNMGSPKEFGRVVEGLLSKEGELQKLKDNCNKASKVLNWNEEGKKLLKIYEEILMKNK